MKKLILLGVIVLAFPAWAKDQSPAEKITKDYMQCDGASNHATEAPAESRQCSEQVNKKYCDWLATLPAPVQDRIEMELACNFLAAEFKNDGSEKDLQIRDTIQSLTCFDNDAQNITLLREFWNQGNEARALLFFVKEYLEADAACFKNKEAAS